MPVLLANGHRCSETTKVSHSSWKSCPRFLPHLLLCSSTHVNELCILIDSQLKLEDGHLFFRENKQGKLHTVQACSRSMNSSGSVSLAWGMELHFYRSDCDLLQSLRRCQSQSVSELLRCRRLLRRTTKSRAVCKAIHLSAALRVTGAQGGRLHKPERAHTLPFKSLGPPTHCVLLP